MPPAVALPSLPPGPVTLVDLIERRGGFDWREAVAVIHQICAYLREHSPHVPILLDPRNIQITDQGEVQLLSGQASSDPLVIQVGRLLRTMLAGRNRRPSSDFSCRRRPSSCRSSSRSRMSSARSRS